MHKTTLMHLLIPVLFSTCFCYAATEASPNPGISLNPQDVPIFYDANPLTGMQSFAVMTSFPSKNAQMQLTLNEAIEKTLKAAGQVIHLKENDMRGFGTGNVLLIQIGNVTEWNGKETPLSRVSLCVETSVTLDKTGIKTFPMIWQINTFIPGPTDLISAENLLLSLQKLVSDFVQNYQYANSALPLKPVFYTYH